MTKRMVVIFGTVHVDREVELGASGSECELRQLGMSWDFSSCLPCFPSAHDDAIWTAAWGKSEADGSETIITGSLDDLVKVWKWCEFLHLFQH